MPSLSELIHTTVVEVIVAIIMAASVAIWGRVKDKLSWSTVTVYVLVSIACVIIIFGRFLSPQLQPQASEVINDQNIESKVREWLDAFKIGTRLITDDKAYFNFEVSPGIGNSNRRGMNIARMRNHPHYLTLASRFGLSDDEKAFFNKLSEPQKTEFVLELGAELSKAKISAIVDPSTGSLLISIINRVPITNGLTEATFLQQVNEVSFAQGTVIAAIELGLIRRGKPTPQLLPTPGVSLPP